MKKIRKRIYFTGWFIFAFILVLIMRLSQIQLLDTESFSKYEVNLIEESVKQRTQQVLIDDGRGQFVDRNGQPIGRKYIPTLVLFPFLKNYSWPIEKLLEIVDVPKQKIISSLKSVKEPVLLNKETGVVINERMIEEINNLKIPGVFGVYMETKPSSYQPSHLIGMTSSDKHLLQHAYPERKEFPHNAKIGVLGLEQAFDEFLQPEEETKLMYHVDGIGRPLFGVNVKYIADANPFYPISIKTTIDLDLQQMAEEIVDRHQLSKGGLILLDIETNEVLALVSRPSLNRNDVKTYKNYMYETLFPGSVFKTVIAAAAIEENLIKTNQIFNCDLNLYGEYEKDLNKRHGKLNFEDSFAKSCNYTFATLSEQLMNHNENLLEEYAEKLGLTNLVGWTGQVYHYDEFKQIPVEQKGVIWEKDENKKDLNFIRQTAIGQKDVKVSPLAVANMLATIARGGEKREVKIASSILYKNGTTMFEFEDRPLKGDTISPYTAQKLQNLLRQVVVHEEGTGRRFQTLPFKVAGKSGTAETGRHAGEEKLYHKWFAGYFPFEQPKYALVVVEMDKKSNESVTNAVYYDVVNALYNIQKS